MITPEQTHAIATVSTSWMGPALFLLAAIALIVFATYKITCKWIEYKVTRADEYIGRFDKLDLALGEKFKNLARQLESQNSQLLQIVSLLKEIKSVVTKVDGDGHPLIYASASFRGQILKLLHEIKDRRR